MLDHLDQPNLASQVRITRDHWVREVIARVELSPDRLRIELDPQACQRLAEHEFDEVADPEPLPTYVYQPTVHKRSDHITLDLNIQIKRHDGRRIILAPDGKDLIIPSQIKPKPHIVQAIGQAYAWLEQLSNEGASITAFASQVGVNDGFIHRRLNLTKLGPKVLAGALAGTLPPRINLDDLYRAARDLDWTRQIESLGLGDAAAQ
ncbi:MAG: hypothetical protein AAFY08_08965 [Planctomycetota bacterium]